MWQYKNLNILGRMEIARAFSASVNGTRTLKILLQYSGRWLPPSQTVNFSTSMAIFRNKREKQIDRNDYNFKELRVLAKYRKYAADQGLHFNVRHKNLEEKSKTTHVKSNNQVKTENMAEKTKEIIIRRSSDNSRDYLLPHPIWSEEEVKTVEIKHKSPKGISDNLAYYAVQFMRKTFDLASGYTIGKHLHTLDERSVLIRCIFLETVAGVPGFTAAMVRHLHSLRRMQRDHGWIHTLLEEAENERMHLMTFLQLKKPGPIFRFGVIVTQYIFTAGFFLAYLVSPTFCHRFVGYLEEEAVKTYTHILEEIDAGRLPMWTNLPAPDIAITYWQLPENPVMRDVILAVRADEAHHRDVNHVLASMKLRDKNPFKAGE